MLSGRGRRAGAERRRTAPPAPALLADMALPGRLAVLFLRDMPGVRGVNPSLGCTIVGTRSVRLLWAVAAPPRPPSSPSLLQSSPCAEVVLLFLSSPCPPTCSRSTLAPLLSNSPGPELRLPQYPLALSTLGSISRGALLPKAKPTPLLEFRLLLSSLLSRSLFRARIASRLSSSVRSISFRLWSTCILRSISLLRSCSMCLLLSTSCCSRNF